MQDFFPVTHLLVHQRTTPCIVAYDRGRPVDWKEFAELVLRGVSFARQTSAQIWGVYFVDSLQFAAVVLALWQTDRQVVLLKDNLELTVNEASSGLDALVGDFDTPNNFSGEYYTWKEVLTFSPADTSVLKVLSGEDIALYIYTSGSTGTPKKIPIKFFQLANETASHERLWGASLLSSPVVATVSHQHLYGLIFKVIWPLSAARPFINKNIDYLEDLTGLARQHLRLILISTPSHLARLPDNISWENMRGFWAAVFSSAAPLPLLKSREARQKFGIDITEVYGSSETGGVGWRQQTGMSGEVWQTFPGIKIDSCENTGVLKLRSPFLPDDNFYITSDRVELISDTHFKLLGRVDRIAKIEGKRVSLDSLEQALLKIPYVENARVIVGTEKRVITCAVLILSDRGWLLLEEQGKARLTRELKQYLRQGFEAVVIPRKWRYVKELPCDQQGKVTQKNLRSLFGLVE